MIKAAVVDNAVSVPACHKKKFLPNTCLREESIKKCFSFALEMAYGRGHHKPQSFGRSDSERAPDEIFTNTFQGKISELAVYNLLHSLEIRPDRPPEFDAWGKGKWEDCDFTLNGGNIRCSVKSTKSFGNLLLLEKEKYTEAGEFRETENKIPQRYDFTFLVRTSGIRLDGPDTINFKDIAVEVTGFMAHDRFLEVISQKQIIKMGTILGVPLIVDNYYIFAKDLDPVENFRL